MPWRCAELCLGGTPTPKTKLTHRPSQLKTLQHNSFPMFLFCSDSCHHVWNFLRINPCRGGGRWGQSGPWTPALSCASSFPGITPVDSRPLTNKCMRIEDLQKVFFLLVDLRPPLQSRGVVMNSRSSGLVYGELGEQLENTSSGPTPLKAASHSSPAREDKDTLSRRPSKTKRREIEPQRRNLLHSVLILRVCRQKEETRAGPPPPPPAGKTLITLW